MSQQLRVESKQARRQFAQCQQCHKAKGQVEKLFTCTRCKVATYCSQSCQKLNWPIHKSKCNYSKAQWSQLATLDGDMLSRLSSAPDIEPGAWSPPLPSVLKEELHAFTAKFNPALFQAGFNAVGVTDHSMGWKQVILWVFLERLPSSPTSRPWSRFRVNAAEPMPVLGLAIKFGMDTIQPFLQQKEQHERIDQENGNLGTITIMMSCACEGADPPFTMHNSTWIAFGSHSRAALQISDSWRDTLKDTVDKLCGRSSPTATAQGSSAQ